jgi:hypothetical protein
MVGVWKNFEVHAGKKTPIGQKRLLACDSGEFQKEKMRRESLHLLKEYLNNHKHNISRSMDVKGYSDEVSDGNEEQDIRNGRKRSTWTN